MDLEIMSINFLRSGALSVEVGAQSAKNAPPEPALDVVKMWIYIPSYDKNDRMEDIMNTALNIARDSLK